jgi:transcriptional regulator with XRE-family HTH domain
LSVVHADNKSLFCFMGHPSIQLFGETVRHFRKLLNITQEELADKAGFHRTYIGQIERSERNPAFKNVVTLCQALQVPLSEFFSHYEGLGKPTNEKA